MITADIYLWMSLPISLARVAKDRVSDVPRAVLVGQGGAAAFTDCNHAVLTKLLQWPAAQLFPALDLARLLALENAAAQQLASSAGSMGDMPDSEHIPPNVLKAL